MLFSIIVGNPPYTVSDDKNIYESFIISSSALTYLSIFICPDTFFNRKYSLLKDYLSFHFYNKINIINPFKEQVHVSIFLFSKVYSKKSKFSLDINLRTKTRCLRDIEGVFIFRGITTGCNKAFIIDKKTKDYLCYKDSRNSDLIKPLLKKSKIRKWSVLYQEEFFNSTKGYKFRTRVS